MESSVAVATSINYFFGTAGGVIYVYPGTSAGVVNNPVTVGIDDVFASAPRLPLRVGVFTVAPTGGGGRPPYTITAAGGNGTGVWDFSAARTVRADFDQLLLALEGLGLKPGRLPLIRGWLAQALPQTFAECLYLRYGFDQADRYVDLDAGMRLRLDFQSHQAVDPEASPLNGFVGAGSTTVDVVQVPSAQYGTAVALDPFLSSLQGFAVPSSAGGAGGVVDLRSLAPMPYWRLLYPPTFTASDGTGAVGPQENAVLIGAASWSDLTAATATYLAQRTAPATSLSFRGRTTVVPEVPLYLQNQRVYVTLGTTIRHVLSGSGPVPWLVGGGVASLGSNQEYARAWTPLSTTSPINWTVGAWAQVLIGGVGGGRYATAGDTLDSFDLPVLGGDVFSLVLS